MFRFSNEPIEPLRLRAELAGVEAGALVVFEGNVRNQNHGKPVVALEYEGADALATGEFTRIEEEARRSFAVLGISCVHRTGRLVPGNTAVWIGVTAVHRDAAFAACQFVIDQLKQRLPVWKKEHYADGASGWLNTP